MVSPEQFAAFVQGLPLPADVVRRIDRELCDPASDVAEMCRQTRAAIQELTRLSGKVEGETEQLSRTEIQAYIHGAAVSPAVQELVEQQLREPGSLASRVAREYTLLSRLSSEADAVLDFSQGGCHDKPQARVEIRHLIDYLHGKVLPEQIELQLQAWLQSRMSGAARWSREYLRLLAQDWYPEILPTSNDQ